MLQWCAVAESYLYLPASLYLYLCICQHLCISVSVCLCICMSLYPTVSDWRQVAQQQCAAWQCCSMDSLQGTVLSTCIPWLTVVSAPKYSVLSCTQTHITVPSATQHHPTSCQPDSALTSVNSSATYFLPLCVRGFLHQELSTAHTVTAALAYIFVATMQHGEYSTHSLLLQLQVERCNLIFHNPQRSLCSTHNHSNRHKSRGRGIEKDRPCRFI